MSIGDALAQARSQAGLTIAQVSQRTCIRETIVRGIERGDFSACGGDFYARGHIRSIARVVGLDPEELIREYDATHGTHPEITAAEVFEPATPIKLRERRSPNWSVAMGVVLAAVLGYGVFRAVAPSPSSSPPKRPVAVTTPRASHTPTAAPSSSPKASPGPSSSPTPSSVSRNVVVQLVAIEDCWVEFTTASGGYIQQDLVVGGTTKNWTFQQPVQMRIGNPGGIQLTINGQKYSPGTAQPVTLSIQPGKPLSSAGG